MTWNEGWQVQRVGQQRLPRLGQRRLRGTSGMGPWPWVKLGQIWDFLWNFPSLLPALLPSFSVHLRTFPPLNPLLSFFSRQPSAVGSLTMGRGEVRN